MKSQLKEGEILALEGDARGMTVSCRRGVLWLTQPGDGKDHVLKAGEEFTITRKGKIVILALAGTNLSLTPPASDTESIPVFRAALFRRGKSAPAAGPRFSH